MGFGASHSSSQDTSQESSKSSNQAFPFLQNSLGGQVDNVGRGANAVASLLGLGGSQDQTAAFNQFKDSSGYNFIQDQGIRGINGTNAAKGLLNSGSALKGISQYSSNLASGFLNSYLSNLMGLSNNGIQAGQVLSSAGNTSSSQGTKTGSSSGGGFNASFK